MPTNAIMPPELKSADRSLALPVFVATTTLALVISAAALALPGHGAHSILFASLLAILFAGGVVALRAATLPAAVCGMLIAFITWRAAGSGGFGGLFVLFVTTWLATRIGREKKRRLGTVESRHGRRAAQVLANLAVFGILLSLAALTASRSGRQFSQLLVAGAAAALAEAAGDTVSSEIGQVYGGTPFMITSFRPAPAGTDGAVTLVGTAAGAGAAVLVLATWAQLSHYPLHWLAAPALGAIAGILFDSLLGATLERRGYLENDGVNFTSTLFAAAVAVVLLRMHL